MDHEKIEKALHDAGLTRNELKVYLALLRIGDCKAGKISKEAETNRSYTYDALKKLLEKGLISYAIIGKQKYFRPVNPNMLLALLKQRTENIEDILPHLRGLYKQKEEISNIRLYRGIKGVQTVLMNIIDEGKPNDVFGSEWTIAERMPAFSKHFIKGLERKKIRIRHIVRHGVEVAKTKTAEIRFAPEATKSPVVTNIYGDKIAIIIWSKVPEAVIIHNKEAANSYRNYFEVLWNAASKK